jgi:hypothetical protein
MVFQLSAIRILSAYELVEAITVKKITATIFESSDFIKFLLFMIFYNINIILYV